MRRSKRDAIFATSLYREKYYTELAEERQTTPGLRLKKLGITNKSETRRSPCWILDLCQYFGQKKSKDHAAFLSSSSSFC